jgi:GDPmannose 4,6-dehydratase
LHVERQRLPQALPCCFGYLRSIALDHAAQDPEQDEPDDYVLATGEKHSVREFVERAFACVDLDIDWRGSGTNEKGIHVRSGRTLIEVDPRYFRPTEVDLLLGDPSKARQRLGWRHKTSFDDMVKDMVAADLMAVRREKQRKSRHD